MGVGAATVLAAMAINPVRGLITVLRPGAIIAIGATDASNAIATMAETRAMWSTIAPITTAVYDFIGMLPTFLGWELLAYPFTYLFLLVL